MVAMKGRLSHAGLLDFISGLHGMVGREHFRRDLTRWMLESRLISAPIVHVLEYDHALRHTFVEDGDGPVLVDGVPLGDLLPGRQEDLPSFKYTLEGNWEPTVMTQFLSPSKLRGTALYSEVNRPLGMLDVLLIPLVRADKIYSLVLTRETCFTESDRQMACRLQGQIIVAMRNHQALLHAEQSDRLLRLATQAGPPLILPIGPDGALADWPAEAGALFGAGAGAPADLAEWVCRRIAHYPWLSPSENALHYVARRGLPPVHVHFLGRRNGRHELLCFPEQGIPRRHGLTNREKDVLGWLCHGKRNKEIAAILGISEFTARNHVEKILKKLGAENRGSAVAMARGWFGE